MPPGSGPTWAALPHELVQQAAGLLGDEDRWVGGWVGEGGRRALAGAAGRAGEAAAKVGMSPPLGAAVSHHPRAEVQCSPICACIGHMLTLPADHPQAGDATCVRRLAGCHAGRPRGASQNDAHPA